MSDEFNPFNEKESTNPFDDTSNDEDLVDVEIHVETEQKPIIPVQDNIPTYTSLEEEQVHTIMRSVSMDDTEDLNVPEKELSESSDLVVTVDSPEKHTEGYVSYSVTTKTSREGFEMDQFKVRRRYQDFLWLKEKLQEQFPTHIVPPLPEKFTFTKHMTDKYDSDFLKTRTKALDKFMCRLVEHPVLSFSDNLKIFLCAKAWEMTTARKKALSAAAKVGGSVRNTAAQMMMKNRDEEFNETNTYINSLQTKLKSLSAVTEQVAQGRFFLLDDLTEYGSSFRLWSNSESRLTETLNAVAESTDKKCENIKSMLRIHDLRIAEPLREYILYCEAVKIASKKRDQMQIEHELVIEELEKRKAEKEEVESGQAKSLSSLFGKDPEKAKEERLTKLNQTIRDLTSEAESLANNRATADQDFRADLERWSKTKSKDMKSFFLEIADRHIKLYESNITAWQSALDVISKPRKI